METERIFTTWTSFKQKTKGQHVVGTYLCIIATNSRLFTWSQPNVKEKRRASSLMLLKEVVEESKLLLLLLPSPWLSTCF